MQNKLPQIASLTANDFIMNDTVKQCILDLKAAFPPDGKGLIVSDVLDEKGNQYVNLVQKGGGVLGMALIGYTYVLEQMGIRFIRLAGTSAGAINTALMTVIGNKEDQKSIGILEPICKLDFFKFVDGPPAAQWIIKKFVTTENFLAKSKKWILALLLIFAILFAGSIIFLGLQPRFPQVVILTKLFFVSTVIFILLFGLLGYYITTFLKRLKNAGYGINPGNYFYDWIKGRLLENGVKTVTDLINKATGNIPGLHLRVPNPANLEGLKGDVTFITSELVTQNKIQFPEMSSLFRKNIDELEPAGFIRASMSIPIFFESYFINEIPAADEDIKKQWMDKFGVEEPPLTARFVDGGILSDLPISLFYNPQVIIPRLPSFGIDLDDSIPDNKANIAERWTLLGYFGRIFNTIRYYYDKDFLLKNKVYKKGIGTVHLEEYNWLNFFLTPQNKIDLFVKGALAAKEFLIQFNWDEYKNSRHEMSQNLLKELP